MTDNIASIFCFLAGLAIAGLAAARLSALMLATWEIIAATFVINGFTFWFQGNISRMLASKRPWLCHKFRKQRGEDR